MKKLLLKKFAALILLAVGTGPVFGQTISFFSWDIAGANELIADIGPNGQSSGSLAEAQPTGNGTPQGLAPGSFTQSPGGFCCVFSCDPCCVTPNNCGKENINLVVPNPGGIFDQPEIRYSIDYRRTNGNRRADESDEYGESDQSSRVGRKKVLRLRSVHHVDKLKADIMLVHGAKDERAPIEQFDALVEALKAINYPHKTMVIGDEGHGFYNDKHHHFAGELFIHQGYG